MPSRLISFMSAISSKSSSMRRLISSHNSVATPFRSTDKEDHKHYLTLSSDKLERDGILISPLSILRMRV